MMKVTFSRVNLTERRTILLSEIVPELSDLENVRQLVEAYGCFDALAGQVGSYKIIGLISVEFSLY